MQVLGSATIFHVRNLEVTIPYYTDVLRFRLDFRYRDLAGLEYRPVLVYLSGPAQDVKKTAGEGSMYVFCDAVDAYYQDILVRGAFIYIDLDNRSYGMRDFAIKDPDGNIITFGKKM